MDVLDELICSVKDWAERVPNAHCYIKFDKALTTAQRAAVAAHLARVYGVHDDHRTTAVGLPRGAPSDAGGVT